MSTDAEELLKTALGEIEKVMTANTVIGDPVSCEGKTIIPVAGMSVDFGGGGGEGSMTGKETGESNASIGAGSALGGAGGGAGGGFTIKPVALIIIDNGELRIEHLKVEQLKFEKPAAQSAYQPSAQPPAQSPVQTYSHEPVRGAEPVDSAPYLAKEVRQLRRDIDELQTKLGITPLD
ncbi:MAG TPA: spore germination protein GerW family protein [Methanotrichaceae archaeon]|nr:spore germination protein GerW family protein [Methanotrichaceae archaeon]